MFYPSFNYFPVFKFIDLLYKTKKSILYLQINKLQ